MTSHTGEKRTVNRLSTAALMIALAVMQSVIGWTAPARADEQPASLFQWDELPNLPDPLGVAGPFVGVHNDALIVAGGANFPTPVWETDKVWKQAIYALAGSDDRMAWTRAGELPRAIAYGMCVSHATGVICIGGNDGLETFDDVFRMRFDEPSGKIAFDILPSLPRSCAYGQATIVGDTVFVAGGQSDLGLETAMANFWSLDLSLEGANAFRWIEHSEIPWSARAFNTTASQHNGYAKCIYVSSGRRESNKSIEFLSDHWEYSTATQQWRQRADLPRPMVAGMAFPEGQSHLVYPSGDDGSLFHQADALKDKHPGFPQEALLYHTITDSWTNAGTVSAPPVTTVPVRWRGQTVIATGEVRPRVRTAKVWAVSAVPTTSRFGAVNYAVLVGYLIAVVGIGVYFAVRNRTTDDFFRGGQNVPWWAAGCSIFATMLSSLTFTGLPSKAFAQDWVYAVGNLMIPVVAILAVFVALPFYRRIDATSAYEYLERRFSRPIRLFASASFTFFHLFRMAVVMSLTALALAVATPLSPMQAVLLMGLLSIAYSVMGGVEAVIWTDTLQTVVLLGGAVLAVGLLLTGVDGGPSNAWSMATAGNKLDVANWHWDPTDARVALWVVVLGAFGQNVSSYTADQAVVQRYMTTPTQKLAARSIWLNAVLAIPATILFFAIGTALFAYYKSHPERLDPTMTTDQIFPLFIAREMPIGIAGLIVAGIFSAAQSTVSTSMNSTATTVVTDFLRPLNACRTERGYLITARIVTLVVGCSGTMIALFFIDPEIHSLFDAFIKVIGMFMGVLGGLFLLGVFTTRANAAGAAVGVFAGAVVMASLWLWSSVHGFLYTTCGIGSCFVVGYLVSLCVSTVKSDLAGLTIYDSSAPGEDAANAPANG